jgi:Domain of unknown function (DUF4430)
MLDSNLQELVQTLLHRISLSRSRLEDKFNFGSLDLNGRCIAMYTATLAIDNNILSAQTVSLQTEMNVRELIEATFVQLQTAQHPDPFKFTIEYYGYDYYQGILNYLGYFIVSINQYASTPSAYWDLYVNGKSSQIGMDSYLIQPNDQIELKWIITPPVPASMAARIQRVKARRAQTGSSSISN